MQRSRHGRTKASSSSVNGQRPQGRARQRAYLIAALPGHDSDELIELRKQIARPFWIDTVGRAALVEMLTQYQDACGTPVTVFFDGTGARRTKPKNNSGGAVEVLFSSSGQTADDLIERAAHRFQPYGEVLVVTDDFAERDTVSGFGGSVASCGNFIALIQNALADLSENLNNHNRSERNRFFRSR